MESHAIIPEIETVATREQIASDGIIQLNEKFGPHFRAFAALYEDAKEVQDDEPNARAGIRSGKNVRKLTPRRRPLLPRSAPNVSESKRKSQQRSAPNVRESNRKKQRRNVRRLHLIEKS